MSFKKVLAIVDGEVIDQEDNKTGINPSITIEDAGVLDTGIAEFVGILSIKTASDGAVGSCSIASDAQVLDSLTGSAVFSDTKATASKVNVYVEDGTIQVQNLTGADIEIEARLH